jgi:hypothetical protein
MSHICELGTRWFMPTVCRDRIHVLPSHSFIVCPHDRHSGNIVSIAANMLTPTFTACKLCSSFVPTICYATSAPLRHQNELTGGPSLFLQHTAPFNCLLPAAAKNMICSWGDDHLILWGITTPQSRVSSKHTICDECRCPHLRCSCLS